MIKKTITISILSLSSIIFSQNKAENGLKTFEEKYPQEKIHLLFDKSSYIAGDNLWFKSYVFTGYTPTTVSTSLFVELYDSKKTLLDKKIIPLINGEGNGNFSLSENLKENVYFVRAYTTWSTNFSEDFQEIRTVEIYNPASHEKLVPDNISKWSATVHPESNSFIKDINTTFAVRLHSKGKKPTEWTGYVTEASKPDTKITTFKGLDENTGSFKLKPESGKKYQLTIQDSSGGKQTLEIPMAASSGYHLQVESKEDAIDYSVISKNNSSEAEYYTLIGTMNSQVVYKAKLLKLSGKKYSIPANKLINGILQLSLFDSSEKLISQRMCFVQPKKLQVKTPQISQASLDHKPRSYNSFAVSDKIDSSTFTALVLEGDSKSSEDEESLLSTVLLAADITEDISSPAQYFNKNRNPDALDAILISSKWRRFDWKNLTDGVFPVIRNKTNPYLSYKGKVTVLGKPAANEDLNLIFEIPDSGTKFYQTKTDSNGYFSIDGLNFDDSVKFSYQLNNQKIQKKDLQVIFQPDYSFVPLRKDLPEVPYQLQIRNSQDQLPPEVIKYAESVNTYKIIDDKSILIEEVTLKKTKEARTQKLNDELSSSLFKKGNEVVFDLVNDITGLSYTNILQFLQGRVAGLQINISGLNASATFRGAPIAIFLDEMPVSASEISSISASDVAMIKVFRGFFAGASGGGNGAIAIYTKRGGISGTPTDAAKSTALKQTTLKGYDKEVFYKSPDYSNDAYKNISKDVRTVLFWNPNLKIIENKAPKIEFYNNDESKNYRVIIIGYDSEGILPLYYDELLKP